MTRCLCRKSALRLLYLGLALGPAAYPIASAEPEINWNLFTHFEAYQSSEPTTKDDIKWGESALFLTGRLTDRLSFLSEISYEIPKYRDQSVKVERLRLRYDLNRNNWIIAGKMHTPVNYWNDNFHHGRLFFPSINRPKSFSRFIPIHEIGLRLGGKNFFGSNIGYDIVFGSGQSAGNDVFAEGIQSYTATASWTPLRDLKIMGSYYRDTILNHQSDSNHQGHGLTMTMEPANSHGEIAGPVDIDYEMYSFSMHWGGDRFRVLTELSMNRTDDGEFNRAAYQYIGYHVMEDLTLYGLYDMVDVDDSELHFAPGRDTSYGVGLEYVFGVNASIKTELRRRDDHTGGRDLYNNEIQVQLSFGI